MNLIYSRIMNELKSELASQKKLVPERILLDQLSGLPEPQDLKLLLSKKVKEKEVSMISVIKKAVPIKGLLRKQFDIKKITKAYEQQGSLAISVVTESKMHQGKREFLKEVRSISNLPLIRQDIIFDNYQVIESRILGADAIILQLDLLTIQEAINLEHKATELGMGVILEISGKQDLEKIAYLKSKLICVNNRDPRTLEVNLDTTKILSGRLGPQYMIICKNGIQNIKNIKEVSNYNVYLFMIGEYILNQPNIEVAIQMLLGQPSQ